MTPATLEVRISTPHEIRFSTKKHEARIQKGMSLRHTEPKSPHPYGFEASSSNAPATDLRDYLIRKKSVQKITPQSHCEHFI